MLSWVELNDISSCIQSLREVLNVFNNRNILIIGGAGFIGSWICDILSATKCKLVIIDNLLTSTIENIKHLLSNANIEFINNDFLKVDINSKFDYILYLAARPSPDDYMRNPVETLLVSSIGLYKALEIARKHDAVFLFTSTSEVYGDAEVVPTPETYWGKVNPTGPRSCYDEGKRFGEALCMAYHRQYGLDVRVARIFNTYGPRLDWKNPAAYGRVIIKFIIQALRNEPITIYGDGKQTRSFCYITDCIEALIKLITTPEAKGEVVNIGNPEEVTILELAQLIKELTKSSSTIIFLPPRPDDPRRRCPDITKARRLLKWQPKVSLREGLKRTIEWVRLKMNIA